MVNELISYRARYVFPVNAPPIRDGVVTVTDGIVSRLDAYRPGLSVIDLEDAALIPGLVNAHTHLEFSDLTQPVGSPATGFCSWIKTVIEHRRHEASACVDWSAKRRDAVARGLSESQQSGVTAIGEIATDPWSPEPFDNAAVDATVFLEAIGLSAEAVERLIKAARDHLERTGKPARRWRPGLSPHAPYTANPALITRLAEMSAEFKVPLAMHLAESVEELELLQSASGPFVELLDGLGAWDATALPRGIRPLDYLEMLANADRSLIVHGNYLDSEEIDFAAEHADSMSIIYCPRTHAYFEHGNYPLLEMLNAGVNVAVGTDSRASNPDLNLFDELRFIARRFPQLSLDKVLALGTKNGAAALGLANGGTIEVGKPAAVSVVRLGVQPPNDAYEAIFDKASEVLGLHDARLRLASTNG